MKDFRFAPLGLIIRPKLLKPTTSKTTHEVEVELKIITALTPWIQKMENQHAYHFQVRNEGPAYVIRAAKVNNEIKLINMSGAICLIFPLHHSVELRDFQHQAVMAAINLFGECTN